MFCMTFFSNNPLYASLAHNGLEAAMLPDSSSIEILRLARDRIHQGHILAHHPLYGNFRPHLQPYRSILLHEGAATDKPDPLSLELISEAMLLYQREEENLALPWSLPASLREDCALLDMELLRETLAQSGIHVDPACAGMAQRNEKNRRVSCETQTA